MSWAPYGSNMKDTEIGINSNVAKAIGKCVSSVRVKYCGMPFQRQCVVRTLTCGPAINSRLPEILLKIHKKSSVYCLCGCVGAVARVARANQPNCLLL